MNCNECEKGYFKYTYGQCFSCQNENHLCLECHINYETSKYECDKCIDGYIVNEKTKKCEPISCDEYPEISPGCIICNNKIDEYKKLNKCQFCGEGFFKTKNDSCIFCKAKNNGGPACELCEYKKDENGNDSDEIKCKFCLSNNILNSDGRCFNCKDELGQECTNCAFIKTDDNYTEILECTKCSNNYNLNWKGHCISYKSYYQKLPQCSSFSYDIIRINKYICTEYIENKEMQVTINDLSIIFPIQNKCIKKELNKDYSPENNFIIKTKCSQCKKGFYKDINGNCEGLSIETCSYISILESNEQKYNDCKNFCNNNSFAIVNYIMNKTLNNTNENVDNNDNKNKNDKISINIDYILENYGINSFDLIDGEIKDVIIKGQLCISNSKNKNLKKCKITEFIDNEYICKECIDGYYLDKETKLCKQNNKLNLLSGITDCYLENIGSNFNPIYSCKKCYNNNNIFVYKENGAKICKEPIGELEGCKEVYLDNSYVKNVYNCTECSLNYISYYNRFFNRKICQNIYQEIIRKKELSDDAFSEIESIPAKNGSCESNKFFTPDGINCYACNNKEVGMVGCKGSCAFSLYRNNIIECEEDGCKTGYLESTKGICESCNIINNGCIECHYEDYTLGNYNRKKNLYLINLKKDI